MSIADVKSLSPATMDIKKVVKTPLIFFTSTAAQLASLSNIIMKLIGAVIAE